MRGLISLLKSDAKKMPPVDKSKEIENSSTEMREGKLEDQEE
jgi:hypothetical protein